MANITLTPEVSSVLRRSKIEGNVLILPPEQLPRPLYESVNKVIVNAGGKWKRGTGHVFTSDPRDKLGLVLEVGVSVDEKKKFQAFYTPPGLAARVVELAGVSGKSVLEPSAGEGALVKECLAQGASRVVAVELNPEAFSALERLRSVDLGRLRTFSGDFLAIGRFCEDAAYDRFDRVVMNPPFTKNQDIKHAAHALKFLRPSGRLVAIMSPMAPEKDAFKRMVAGLEYETEDVPAGTFKESGTDIRTVIVTINKP